MNQTAQMRGKVIDQYLQKLKPQERDPSYLIPLPPATVRGTSTIGIHYSYSSCAAPSGLTQPCETPILATRSSRTQAYAIHGTGFPYGMLIVAAPKPLIRYRCCCHCSGGCVHRTSGRRRRNGVDNVRGLRHAHHASHRAGHAAGQFVPGDSLKGGLLTGLSKPR